MTDIKISAGYGLNELRRMNSVILNGNSTATAISWKPLIQLSQTDDADVYVATNGTHGLALPINEKDSKYVLLIRNVGTSADKTVYIKAGDAEYYGAQNALAITASKATAATESAETVYPIHAICLDSARYMQMSGKRKGCVVVLSNSADVEVALIRLP